MWLLAAMRMLFLWSLLLTVSRSLIVPPTKSFGPWSRLGLGCSGARDLQMVTLPLLSSSALGNFLRKATAGVLGERATLSEPRLMPSSLPSSATDASAVALPWASSVSPTRKLAYMPALETQLDLIRALGMTCVSIEEKFVHRTSSVKAARIGNLCFTHPRFRKVRLTYFDAGESVQVSKMFICYIYYTLGSISNPSLIVYLNYKGV